MHLSISDTINFLLWLTLVLSPPPEYCQWPELGTFFSPPSKSRTPLGHPTWLSFLRPVCFSLSLLRGASSVAVEVLPDSSSAFPELGPSYSSGNACWSRIHNFSYNSLSRCIMTNVHHILQTHNIDLFIECFETYLDLKTPDQGLSSLGAHHTGIGWLLEWRTQDD